MTYKLCSAAAVCFAVALLALPNRMVAQDSSSTSTAKCRDGTYSHNPSRQGTCSNHGGVAAWVVPQDATARCVDGTFSASATRIGACSSHGGVEEWLVPADATARCGDGTYSESTTPQGTCSNHGGVAEWLESRATNDSQAASSAADEQAYVAAMNHDLQSLVIAEEAFFADSVKYTTRIGRGGLDYFVSAGNTSPTITLTRDGWYAVIRNVHSATTCSIFIGETPKPPARKEGSPACE